MAAAMVVGGLLVGASSPVAAQPISSQPFSAYGSGAAVVTKALTLGATSVAGVEAASSGGAVNSGGLNAPVINEFGINIAPPQPGKNALGRGTGAEAGLVTADPQPTTLNQALLAGLALATAPPPSDLVTKDVNLPVNPILYASLLRGQAQAIYDPTFCPVGRPLTYGLGQASNLQLLSATGAGFNTQTGLPAPLLGTSISAFGTPRGVSQSRTVTYLVPNGDGTYGVASETRQTVAPISLLANQLTNTAVTVEIAGEFGIRVLATGKPNGTSVTYTGNPVLTVTSTVAGVPVPLLPPIALQDITGPNGLAVPIPGVATVALGTPPRALGGALGTIPARAADGTSASGAVDAVRLTLLSLPGLTGLDLAIGHMEGSVVVPAGGIHCDIPVSKVADPDPVNVGSNFTYKINIPSDAGLFAQLYNCDLTGISAVDTVETQSGNPTIQLVSADHGGTISGNKVTFPSLGNYTLGDPPIVLTITAKIPAGSGAGVLRDTVNVAASLGNCRGGTTGEDIVQGNAQFTGSAISGTFTLIAPNVSRGTLAATGGNSWPLVAGGGFLLAALGLVRLRRRATPAEG